MPQSPKIKMLPTVAVALAIIGFLLAGLGTASAQSQTEMNQASSKAARRAEVDMMSSYRKLRAVLTPAQKISLQQSQSAWRKFRDAEADFLSIKAQGGSVYPTVYARRVQQLTQARTQQLKLAYVLFTTEGEM